MEVCGEGFIEHRKPTNRVYIYHLYYTSFTIISWTESTSLALWAPELFGRNNSKTDRHSLPTQIKISTRRKKTCPHFHRDLSIKSLFIIFRPKYGEQRNFKRGEEETSGTNRLQTSALENTPRHTYITYSVSLPSCTIHTVIYRSFDTLRLGLCVALLRHHTSWGPSACDSLLIHTTGLLFLFGVEA